MKVAGVQVAVKVAGSLKVALKVAGSLKVALKVAQNVQLQSQTTARSAVDTWSTACQPERKRFSFPKRKRSRIFAF